MTAFITHTREVVAKIRLKQIISELENKKNGKKVFEIAKEKSFIELLEKIANFKGPKGFEFDEVKYKKFLNKTLEEEHIELEKENVI